MQEVTKEIKEELYIDYNRYLFQTLKQVDSDESLSSEQKVSLVVKIADSFVKMQKLSSVKDVDECIKIVSKRTLKTLLLNLKDRLKSEDILTIIEVAESLEDEFLKPI